MPDIAALKVKILLTDEGRALYPAFGTLASVVASGMDWSTYVDRHGRGWVYDKTSGHADETGDSPAGQQWGLLFVPAAFADEAVAAFPGECERVTEAAATTFFETKATVHLDHERRDDRLLTGYRNELNLLIDLRDTLPAGPAKDKVVARLQTLRTRLQAALDPDDASPGVQKNPRKLWADFKSKHGLVFQEPT